MPGPVRRGHSLSVKFGPAVGSMLAAAADLLPDLLTLTDESMTALEVQLERALREALAPRPKTGLNSPRR